MNKTNIPSLLKWTGSKRALATRISQFIPDHHRYFEPFLGSGAMLYIFGKPGSVGGDLYAPLISFWEMARDRMDELIDDYRIQWFELQNNLPDYYYIVRDRFNEYQKPEDLHFLMRTCVNGIVRFNSAGNYNTSFHLSRKGMRPDRFAKIAHQWEPRLQGIQFRQGDFIETCEDAGPGDFIYLDPPYTGSTQRYIRDLDIKHLQECLEDLNQRKVKWALSFDGSRGEKSYDHDIPQELYKRKENLATGQSSLVKVLNKVNESVVESLYLNY